MSHALITSHNVQRSYIIFQAPPTEAFNVQHVSLVDEENTQNDIDLADSQFFTFCNLSQTPVSLDLDDLSFDDLCLFPDAYTMPSLEAITVKGLP